MASNKLRVGGLLLAALCVSGDATTFAQQRPTNSRFRRPTSPPPATSGNSATTPAKPAPKPGSTAPVPPKSSPFAPPPIPLNTSKSSVPQPPQPRREGEPAPLPKGDATPVPTVKADAKPTASPLPTKKPGELEIAPIPIAPSQPEPSLPSPAASAPRTSDVVKPTRPITPDADGKYLIRYSFSNGETVAWQVEHRAKIITTVQETTQTAETITLSKKVWKVVETLPGGETKFVHLVTAIDMRQKLTGRQEVRYDSETDAEVPPIFADAAKQVGVPLAEVTIDTRGNVLKRADKQKRPEGAPTNTITVVLPEKPLAVGESWTAPFDLTATDAEGQPKIIKARHKLTLEKVEGDLATLRNDTQILSPINDPTIEAQVVQSEQSGTVVFDLRRGRIVMQNSDLDKEVFGFQGPESKLHYSAQFHEKLTDSATATTAAKTK